MRSVRVALACCLVVLAVPGSASAAPAVVASTTLPPGATAFSVSVDPGAGRVYAVDPANHLVRVYDTALSPVGSFAVGPVAWIAAIDPRPASKRLFVVSFNPGSVSVRSLPSGAPICDVPIGPGGSGPAFNAVTGNFYAGAEASQAVFSLHGPSNCAVDAVTFTGDKPIERAISIDPLTNTVFSSVHHAQQTAVIDGTTDTLSALVPTGPGDPTGTATDEIGQRVYVAYSQGGRVTEIDTSATALTPFATHDLAVGNAPRSVATDPGVGRAYVGVRDFGTLAVITNGVVGTPVSLGMTPSPPAVDTSTHCVFVPGEAGVWKIVKVCDPDAPALQIDTLAALIRRCTADGGVEDALLKKLEQVASAPNANARAGKIGALRNQVQAQTGKAVDAGCAASILALIDAL